MNFLSITQFAKQKDVARQYIHILCQQKRINGTKRLGKLWLIPKDAEIQPPRKPKRRKRKRVIQCIECKKTFVFFFNTKQIPDAIKYYLCGCKEQKFQEVK
jgi:hypothetical protein